MSGPGPAAIPACTATPVAGEGALTLRSARRHTVAPPVVQVFFFSVTARLPLVLIEMSAHHASLQRRGRDTGRAGPTRAGS